MSEHDHQAALFAMIDLHSARHPALLNCFAIPNGGARTARTGARMKAEGCRRGVPDLFVAWPVGGTAGLFIEMKYGRNKPDSDQLDWFVRLRSAGYAVLVCYSWEDAWRAICDYLGISMRGEEIA